MKNHTRRLVRLSNHGRVIGCKCLDQSQSIAWTLSCLLSNDSIFREKNKVVYG